MNCIRCYAVYAVSKMDIQIVFADDPFFQYMFDQNTVSRALSSGNPPYQHVIVTLIMLLISIMMTMLMMIMIIMETV